MDEFAVLSLVPSQRGWELEEGDEGALGWQERALCAQTDPEAFFPEKGGSTREAKKVCVGCEVRRSAWSTPSRTTSGSASGAGCPSASAGA